MKTAPSSSTSFRILLIDDNKHGLAARKAVLEEFGYQIVTATGGPDGWKQFSEESFDLVVTDYKMPRMNGVQFIKKARQAKPSVPIILLSGFADALGFDEKNTGADIVIQKSANEVNHMLRAVRRLLRKAKTQRKPPSTQPAPPKSRRKSG